MKKFVVLLVILLIIFTMYLLTSKIFKENYELENTKDIAIYIEEETSGAYEEANDNTFPTDGYILNLEKSICTNG